jgi:hypothetical protein
MLTRISSSVAIITIVTCALAGCSNSKGIAVPTGSEAKAWAEAPPPPIIAGGGPGGAPGAVNKKGGKPAGGPGNP